MSTTIERNITEIALDPREFKRGMEQSLGYVDRLKKALNFNQSVQSFQEVEKAADRVSFTKFNNSIDQVSVRVSAMGVVVATTIQNITNTIINKTKQLFNKGVIDPLKKGMAEYETQMNSIQTILANTSKKGTTLENVQQALDELNRYADLTIYNFTQMTDNIGKFTAAGVDLDVSVAAIKGIANLAAVSGSNAHQASTAMYQLSQALASGTVKLMDWNSVVNAGMGGQLFQDSLMETARAHGVAIDQMIEQEGSFRETLQRGWLTDDVLLETLQKFTGDLSEAQLEAMGYTEEQIQEIIKLGEMANDAATKVKTLTQLGDTAAEAIESGWAVTWRTIFGDFEQAKEMFTELSGIFGGLIEASSESRNWILHLWNALGGRDKLIGSIMRGLRYLINIIGVFGEGIREIFPSTTAMDLIRLTDAFGNLVNMFKMGLVESARLRIIVTGLASVFDIVLMLVKAILKPLWSLTDTFTKNSEAMALSITQAAIWVKELRDWIKETGYFDQVVSEVIATVGRWVDVIKDLYHRFLELDVVKEIVRWFTAIEKEDVVATFDRINDAVQTMINLFSSGTDGVKELFTKLSGLETFQAIGDKISGIKLTDLGDIVGTSGNKELPAFVKKLNILKETVGDVAGKFKDFFNELSQTNGVTSFLDALRGVDELIAGIFGKDGGAKAVTETTEKFDKAAGSITTISSVLDGLFTQFERMKPMMDKARELLSNIFSSIGQGIINFANQLDFNGIVGVVSAGIAGAMLVSFRKAMSGGWLEDILGQFIGSKSSIVQSIVRSFDSVTEAFGSLGDILQTYQQNIKADTLLKIASAVGIMTASIVVLTFIDVKKLAAAGAIIGGVMVALFGTSGVVSSLNIGGSLKAAWMIVAISASLLMLSAAVKKMSSINAEKLKTSLAALGVGMAELVIVMRAMGDGTDTGLVKQAIAINALSLSMMLMANSVEAFARIPFEDMKKGLMGVAIGMTSLTVAVRIMGSGSKNNLVKGALAITIISGSMLILAEAVAKMGAIPMDTLTQGLIALGSAMLGFAIFSRMVDGKKLAVGAVGVAIMAAALYVLTDSIAVLGGMSLDALIQGLVAMAAALGLMVIAANLMTGAMMGALAIIVMSGAILILSKALTTLGKLSWEEILKALAVLAGTFLVLGIAGLLLAPVVPVLLALGGAMLLIGVAAAALGIGIFLAATGLVALAGSAALIGAGVGIIGKAIMEILPGMATAFGEALVNFMTTLAESAPQLLESGKTLLLTLVTAVTETIPAIVEAILLMVTEVLTALSEQAPLFIETGWTLLLEFLSGIADNIQEVVATALLVIEEFIRGITEGLPGIIDAGYELILTFINAMADAMEEYLPQLIEAVERLGKAFVDGFANAISSRITKAVQAARDLAAAAWQAVKDELGITSPSKVLYALGEWAVQGFINALGAGTSTVDSASRKLAKSAQNGMKTVLNNMYALLEDEAAFSPTVRPVLDMGSINRDISRLNTSYAGPRITAGIVRAGDGRLPGETSPNRMQPSGQQPQVQYIQNNYSPKALTADEIYRMTKMQVGRLANR